MISNIIQKTVLSSKIICLSLIVLLIFFAVPSTCASPIIITPLEDTYVTDETPDTNYDSKTSFYTRYDGAEKSYAYLKFHTDNFSNNSKIYVYTTGGYIASGGYNIHLTSYEWDESVMTWNSGRPATEYSAAIDGIGMSSLNTWYSFDVSSVVNKPGTYSFAIKPDYGKQTNIVSSNAETNKPYLQITPYDFVDIVSNNKTNDDSISFLVNQSDLINFSISPSDITNVSNYTWSVNKVDQINNESSFDFTVPQHDLSQPSTGIWEIRVAVTYQNSSKVYREWLISSLSESYAPNFIDFFHDRSNVNREYYKDPWGRNLPTYNEQTNHVSKGLLTDSDSSSGEYLTADFNITYGTFKFKINNPGVLDIMALRVYGSSEGEASRWNVQWTANEFHDYFAIVNNDGYIPISRRWLGQAPSVHHWNADGWHEITVIVEENGLWSIWDNGVLLPQTFGNYNNAFNNAVSIELLANDIIEMDSIEIYDKKYIYPETSIYYGWYPKWWYLTDSSKMRVSPLNDSGINVFGRNVTLSEINESIDNASIFTYDDVTKTATTTEDIVLRAGTSLIISNETLIFDTSSDELDFAIKNGATINITNSTILATNLPMQWSFASSLAQTVSDPDKSRNITATTGTARNNPFNDFYGKLIIENSIIDNTGNLFMDGAEEVVINNVIFRNHSAISYGDYTYAPADLINHNDKKSQSVGTKALWFVPRLDLNKFIVNNISFETPKTDIDIKVVGGQWIQNTTTIKNSDLSNINISTKQAKKYQYFIFYRQTIENSSVSLLNVLFNSSKLSVETDNSKIMAKYYVDVLVNDMSGNPVNNAKIYITNDNSSHFDYQSQNDYEYLDYISDYYGPGVGGAANFFGISDAQYEQYSGGTYKRWYNALPLDYSTTGTNGHTPLPHENINESIILTDFVLTNPYGTQIRTNFTYTIAVETPDLETFSLLNVDPDSYWQRENPSSSEYTIVAIIPNESSTPSLIGYAPYDENPIIPGNTIMFQTWTNQPMTTNIWKLDGVTVETDSQSWVWENVLEGAHTVTYDGSNANGSVSQTWDINGGSGAVSSSASSVAINTVTQTVAPNQPFTLTIPITSETPLTGAQFDFNFDNSLATVTSVTEGNLLNQDGATTLFNSGTINNAAGTVTNIYGSILGETSVSSQGSLATISITAGSNTGYLNLNLTNVKISDADSNAAPYTLTNATILIDTAPVLSSIGAKSVDEGSALTFTTGASDVDGDSLTYTTTNLPAGASFNTATGAFSWTPADGEAGTYVVTFEVTDGYISDSETVTITVNDGNNAPVITTFVPANSLTFNESDVITVGIVASDADGDALSYTIKIDGITKSTSSSYVWETDYSSAGTHTIDITVSDGVEQVTDQRTIIVNDVRPRWDVNEDGTVDVLDISVIGQKYGSSVEAPYPRWDVNQDGAINVQDMTLTGSHFGETVA